jgi:hypothetical protein
MTMSGAGWSASSLPLFCTSAITEALPQQRLPRLHSQAVKHVPHQKSPCGVPVDLPARCRAASADRSCTAQPPTSPGLMLCFRCSSKNPTSLNMPCRGRCHIVC